MKNVKNIRRHTWLAVFASCFATWGAALYLIAQNI